MRAERYFRHALAVVLFVAHWNKATCGACHAGGPPAAGNIALKHAPLEEGCSECHDGRGGAPGCRHRSDLPVGDLSVPEYYKAAMINDRITCRTCHDVTFQCNNPDIAYSFQNPGFLRNRVSRDTADQCFECHDSQRYAALNPHAGTIEDWPEPTCLLCHERVPQSTANRASGVSFNMQRDLNDICRGCHDVRPHPTGMSFGAKPEGWVHLATPSADVRGKMERWEAATGLRLPLSPYNGEIYCATCHDAHESAEGVAAQQPEDRLRADNICQACHEK
jgi:hypothetical protein